MKKIKIISLLICTIFLTSIFPGLITAKNLMIIDTVMKGESDLIKITDENPTCDIDNNFVVYSDSVNIYIYNIETGETDKVYVGGDVVFPKISENRVVYYDFLYMGFKIYDINIGEKTDLIVTNWGGGDSDSFQFFGDYIVYENYYPDLYSTEIFLYNIATDENIQLTESPGEDYSENPCIYNNIVAWQLCEGNLADIVMYNIDSEEFIRVTNTSEFESETYPSVYDNDIVYSYFYYDKLNGTIMYGLKMYNTVTGDETTIFTEEETTGITPEIFGSIIAYSEPGISLRQYDLISNYDISIYEGSMLVTPWNLNGNYVVFTVLEDGVYLYKYNDPPNQPDISGPTSGKTSVDYNYTFVSTDSDGDDVWYHISWGDTEIIYIYGPYPSGEEITLTYKWSEKGAFIISCWARDIYDAFSDISTLEVTIPRNKAIYNPFLNCLQNHPYLFLLLQKLIQQNLFGL